MSEERGERTVSRPAARRGPYWGVAVCAALAVVGIAAGIAAVVLDEAVLALIAAGVGVVAAAVGSLVDVRRTRAEQSLWEARAQSRGLRRQLRSLEAAQRDQRSPTGEATSDWEIDPASGLIRERHLPVVLQQVIASARRKVQPVSVVFWEVDGLESAPSAARDQALTALAAIAWRTMRESDAVFRIGDSVALGVLVDTAEPGALIVADRVRESLRQSPIGDSLTVSAAIACYPSHALDPVELVSQAGQALEEARARGHRRDHVTIAPGDGASDSS
ncbi:MAG TPA: diguanylate cyclase [Acidimicrobiia bacterium]